MVKLHWITKGLLTLAGARVCANPICAAQSYSLQARELKYQIAPKVIIVSMFVLEQDAWFGIPEFDLTGVNVTVPGLSPLFPDVHCTKDGEICQVTTAMGVVNAAASVSALIYSPRFDLTKTYFMIAGIGGVNPEVATTGSVTFAQWAVAVGMQHEFDIRDLPDNFTTGYVPFGSEAPMQYPTSIYGSEVFELNGPLRSIAANFARRAILSDSDEAQAYRARYTSDSTYAAGGSQPSVQECDVTTSDTWTSGTYLGDMVANYSSLITNGSAKYCATAQEDNATLGALMRGALIKLVDFSRIIIMRTGSNFDRPYPGQSAIQNLRYEDSGGLWPSINNIYLAGREVIGGILEGWNATFADGIEPDHYIGDILGTLGGDPNFGPGSQFLNTELL